MTEMKVWEKLSSKALSIWGLSLALVACTTKTTENSHRAVQDFPHGEQIIVDLTRTHAEQIGVISKITYATTDKYHYRLRFSPNDIRWENSDDEPKQLLVCVDQTVYLYSVRQQANPYYANTTTVEAKPVERVEEQNKPAPAEERQVVEPYLILKNHYTRFVDKRYFFKLFGGYYWAEISKDEYNNKLKDCQVYTVPNENYYQTEQVRK